MHTRKLGTQGLTVSAVGFGCMGLNWAYGDSEGETKAIATVQRAVEIGVTFFDTAEVYGPFTNEELVGRALKAVRDRVVIATKFGFRIAANGGPSSGVDSRPEHVHEVANASLKRLGVETIDLLYQHRVDPQVPIEDTVGAMAELVRAGKVKYLGLSEASGSTIRRAHKVHPISAVQSEWSLWTRDHERDAIPVCRELGIGFVPYSPLGRGFLTGTIKDTSAFGTADFRRNHPRFQDDSIKSNLPLVATLQQLAQRKGCTAGQLAIAWLLNQGNDVVPIPGSRKIPHLEENTAAADIVLSKEDLDTIARAVPETAVVGERYTAAGMQMLDRS